MKIEEAVFRTATAVQAVFAASIRAGRRRCEKSGDRPEKTFSWSCVQALPETFGCECDEKKKSACARGAGFAFQIQRVR
jgi:hypothetical protein